MKLLGIIALVVTILLCGQHVFADKTPADARSVHFEWHKNAENAHAFYNEVKVEKSTNGTYICVCAFDSGYMGIQQLSDGKKCVIFSIWDSDKPDAPGAKTSAADKQVKVLYCDPKVRTERFGGEGTGQQSYYDFPWEIGSTYKFLVRSRMIGGRTAYIAFFFDTRTNEWKHLATFATRPNAAFINGIYSFVEDFRRDHASEREEHAAVFSNGWIMKNDGQWQPLDSATFTAWTDKGNKNQMNIDAWVHGPNFGLATGGTTENKHAQLDKILVTKAHDQTPPAVEHVRAGMEKENGKGRGKGKEQQ